MNGKLCKKLRERAKKLPPCFEEKTVYENGKDLIAHGFKEDGSGNAISKKKRYAARKTIPVDHFKKMQEAWKRDGDKGVEQYEKMVIVVSNRQSKPEKVFEA